MFHLSKIKNETNQQESVTTKSIQLWFHAGAAKSDPMYGQHHIIWVQVYIL